MKYTPSYTHSALIKKERKAKKCARIIWAENIRNYTTTTGQYPKFYSLKFSRFLISAFNADQTHLLTSIYNIYEV